MCEYFKICWKNEPAVHNWTGEQFATAVVCWQRVKPSMQEQAMVVPLSLMTAASPLNHLKNPSLFRFPWKRQWAVASLSTDTQHQWI